MDVGAAITTGIIFIPNPTGHPFDPLQTVGPAAKVKPISPFSFPFAPKSNKTSGVNSPGSPDCYPNYPGQVRK